MTTINDIEDFVRVLQEHPDWLATVRALVLGEELMRLPEQLAQFIAATDRNFQLVNQRLERLENDVAGLKADMTGVKSDVAGLKTDMTEVKSDVAELKTDMTEVKSDVAELKTDMTEVKSDVAEVKSDMTEVKSDVAGLKDDVAELKTGQDRTNRRLNRLEGRFSNFEGSDYERRVRYRFLSRATLEFDLDTPHVAFALQGQMTPALNRIFHRALRERLISPEEFQELHNIDIIIAAENDHYVAGEASLTVADYDITRARERADILALATGNRTDPAVITTAISESQRLLAESNGVSVFIIPYP